jgi:hypothetical protein
MDDRRLSPPQGHTTGDRVASLGRGVLGSVPIVGAAASELFQYLLMPNLERRREAWMQSVADAIWDLSEHREHLVEELAVDERFSALMLQACEAALKSSEEEKLDALRNAILNCALSPPVHASLQQLMLNILAEMTPWHLKILAFLDDDIAKIEGLDKVEPNWLDNVPAVYCAVCGQFPELANGSSVLHRYALLQLERWGLVEGGAPLWGEVGHPKEVALHYVIDCRPSQFGRSFLSFCRDPRKGRGLGRDFRADSDG